ncbi:hypothetical protein EIP86_008916 [Pleurotus ostreatoroseus]|nr:hypothetical protein EIP86_008916 [Pleurotus ostreatoroseus]
MECRLVHAPQPSVWQCQVLLRIETDASGNKVTAREVPFGPVLYDKSELEEMLRRAQLAILNPSLSPSFFENFDTKSLKPGETPPGSERQLAFSNNVVCLDLKGPDVTDLSFIDLPGIISNVAAGEDRGNIEAVKRMVEDHIQGNTLILLTITMRVNGSRNAATPDDIDNQGAAFLAKEADPNGVLTKPDTIQHGEEHGWLRVLDGASHPLKHGYYIVKQPSPKELEEGISSEEARRREVTFFENTFPWNSKATLRQRMGTTNLTRELSRLLGNVINQGLPALRKESKESYQEVKRLLASLPPPPPENPASELLHLVTAFSGIVDNLIQGRDHYETLIQECRPAYQVFKTDIRRTAPRMRPFENQNAADSVVIEDDENDSGFDIIIDGEAMPRSADGEPLPKPMYLDEVRNHIQSSLTRQLPYNVPFRAKVALIEKIFKDWDIYCEKCFSSVYDVTLAALKDCIKTSFGTFRTSLPDHVHVIVEDLVEQCKTATLARIDWMLQLENPPFTLNDHYFANYREEYLKRYKKARQSDNGFTTPEDIAEALAALAKIGHQGLKEDDLPRLFGPDPYEEELIVMAEMSAYFHVVYQRIIDNIPRIIDHDFLFAIGKDLQKSLIDGLSLGTEHATDRAKMYLAEDADVATQRQFLKQKKDRLDGVLKKLYDFGM